MVRMAVRPDLFKGRGAKWFAFGLAIAAAGIGILGAIAAESLLPLVILLNVGALIFSAVTSLKADESLRDARQASSDVATLAGRIARLERKAPDAAQSPVLRSTMAEVTGTVGLLGGVVRELARNVAAQKRDVADLKSSLLPEASGQPQALRVGPDRSRPEMGAQENTAAEPEPSLLPLPRQDIPGELSHAQRVLQAFEADGLELHLQPVVSLPQRKVRSYEALARLQLEDGTLIGPAEFLPVLERFGRAPDFDRRMLLRAVAVARHLVARGSEAVVSVNLSPRALAEADFLRSILQLMQAAPDVTGKIVIEIPQPCWRDFDAEQREVVFALCGRGIPLSLDGATDLHLDIRALAEQGVRFVKLSADLILASAGRNRDVDIRDVVSLLRRSGIRLVAERVEREDMVPLLADLGVPLAQGFVFSPPRAVRAEVLGAAARANASAARVSPLSHRAAG
ncbi:EAL domain-containing protein [Microvirga puerhi]|uniref:EAL domain-containing protein n=1 Tax=Microvirga puerhi TaxID=2876078 RepID=A0ABS7VKP3_9HYPH|nr:EAL domain-containing protein [Microvirga puerhi]MBZ6076108.1 EAL domain-containing protein [Microvirga puerhi]